MGKPVIPNHDPVRLARILDEKTRMMGVRVVGGWPTCPNIPLS